MRFWLLVVSLSACWVLVCGCGEGGACGEGEWRCSDDGRVLGTCASGEWVETDCGAEGEGWCFEGACVLPWEYGAPVWSTCADDPLATPESLAQKAVYYDDIAIRLHVHPDLRWMAEVTLKCDGDDCSRPVRPEEEATWEDVLSWDTDANDGAWSAMYLASQAYRYAVTGSAGCLETIRLLMHGERDRMRITGTPGIFTRTLYPAGVDGISCPEGLHRYIPSPDKDSNQYVRISEDGCIQTVDPDGETWNTSDVCGLSDYAGWCFRDNVSQDEYAGQMYALGLVAHLVDDPDIRADARDLLTQVGRHLMENKLELFDWDGRRAQFGALWPSEVLPGHQAAMSLGFVVVPSRFAEDEDLTDWYRRCLLEASGDPDCPDHEGMYPGPYPEALPDNYLYLDSMGCLSNWNNFTMHMLALTCLSWWERDPGVRREIQRHLQHDVFAPEDQARPLSVQNNPFYDFLYAAHKRLGPDSDGPAYDAVENGVCMLRQFPASQRSIERDECEVQPCNLSDCVDRFGDPVRDEVLPVAYRCPQRFIWWKSPYGPKTCEDDPRTIHAPADYLLPYWMGRYYGFIGEEM